VVDGFEANSGLQPKIERNLPEDTILASWKQEAANYPEWNGTEVGRPDEINCYV
jgi:hypothetical protein